MKRVADGTQSRARAGYTVPRRRSLARRPLPRAFAHPLWWSALALLLANDHVLKGSGLLAGALTGKLSDFAGMVVAPPLLALVYTLPRGRVGRTLPALMTGAALSALKLWPAAAHGLELGARALGLGMRFCPDPTDLWALLALPLGHALCRPAAQPPRAAQRRELTQRLGIALGSLACMATGFSKSSSHAARSDAPAIENDSDRAISLVVSSTEGVGGCRIYRDDRVGLLTDDAFVAAREITLDPGKKADLVQDSSTAACGAARIALQDGQEELVFWRDLPEIEDFVPADDEQRMARTVLVSGKASDLSFQVGDDLQTFELGADPPDSTCAEDAQADSLEFSSLPIAQGFVELGEQRTTSDGCLEVDWFMAGGDTTPHTQTLCVPDWAFPFDEGDTLALTVSSAADGSRSLRVTRYDGSMAATQLQIWNDAGTFPGGRISELAAIDCVGSLSSCGAYVRPIEASVHGRSKKLHPGDDVTLTDAAPDEGQPQSTRVLLGSGQDVAWSAADCAQSEAHLGTTANALELREF